ncbi:MAG TPA: M1 family aminopeptidase [Chitinophagaceae bacterium]|nr:M1 family aminopeptidase [Chitinophagaceae bacterium]
MRSVTLILLLFPLTVFAQQQCKEFDELVQMERQNHERLYSHRETNASAASTNFDVKYYRCEWEVDPAVRYLKGAVTAYYRILSPTSTISFDLSSGLTVDSVRQRGNIVSKQYSSNTLQLTFPTQVNAGVLDSVTIFYQGDPPNSGMGSFVQSTHAGVPIIWTLSEPYGARDWWPCKNGLDDKADSIDVFVTAPAAYKAVSNGLLQTEVNLNNGKKRSWWKHRYPIASYLVAFAVTNYSFFTNTVQLGAVSLPVQTYCYPENLGSFQTSASWVLDALQLYHNTFGDYPFINEKYSNVQFHWGGGMEHQTASFVSNNGEGLLVHELGHQWFGDKITCASWEDIWLNEGFATQLTSVYMEWKYPAAALATRINEINTITSQPGGSVKVDDTSNVSRIFNSRLSYYKGSHLLFMLRWKLGDSVFFRAIRRYQKDPALIYGFAHTDDLRRNLELESGQDLKSFFSDWFEGQGYPSYKVEWNQLGSGYARIKLSQTTSHPSVNFFALPVALKFKNATQEKTIVVDNKSNAEIFIRNIGFRADTVIIDPEYWLISKNNVSKKIEESLTGADLLQVFPNPVKDQFYVYLGNFSASSANLALYNSAGQLTWSKKLILQNGSEFTEVPSAHLASGVYMLQVITENGMKLTKKIIK